MVTKEEEELTKSIFRVKFDPRFPNTNQTRNCFQNYVDFHKCSNKRGENFEACQYFKNVYMRLCPGQWIEKWDNQVEEGTFPVKLN